MGNSARQQRRSFTVIAGKAVFKCLRCEERLSFDVKGNLSPEMMDKRAARAGWVVENANAFCPKHAQRGQRDHDPDAELKKFIAKPTVAGAANNVVPLPLILEGGGAVQSRALQVTPKQAEEWLKKNTGNRPLRQATVLRYATQMERGVWRLTHQGIAFGIDGRLLDGQHRLQAIVLAGVTVPMMVTGGLTEEAFKAIDMGERRAMSDNLHLPRYKVEIARRLALILGTAAQTPTIDEVEALYYRFEPYLSAVEDASRSRRAGLTHVHFRAALVARLINNPAQHGEIIDQWEATTLLAFDRMWPKVQAFVRQMMQPTRSKSSVNDLFARAWLAFDPAARDDSRVQVKDAMISVDEARRALLTA